MVIKPPETKNQADLLEALKLPDAKLVGNGWATPDRVVVPGVPKPVLFVTKQTVKACLRRHYIVGSNEDGYRITGVGVLALRAR